MLNLYNKGQAYKWRSVTFLTEVDATLNSRPLTQILMDISYFNILILVHFIFTKQSLFFFFYLGFLSRIFTIHMTSGEGGGYLFNSSSPLCRHLDTSRAITADSNREPLVAERKSLTTKPLSYVFSVLKWSRATTWQAKFLRKLFKR